MLAQEGELRSLLDALGDHFQPQPAGEPRHRGDDRRTAALGRAARAAVDVGDEGLVDLQGVHGQVAQVRQAGEAGAEVVDRDPKAHAAQLEQREAHALDVAHHAGLGDLEGEPGGRAARGREDRLELGDDGGVAQLARREVHAHREGAHAGGVPGGGLPGGGLGDPAPEVAHEPGLLGDRDEGRRQHQAARRIVPAHQRLRVADAARGDIEDRLVVQLEFPQPDRAPQRGLQPQALVAALRERAGEGAVAVPAQLLRVVHRGVGVLQERLRIVAVLGVHGVAEARTHQHLVAVDREGAHHVVQDLLRHAVGAAVALQVLEDDHELVAREAHEQVALPKRAADPAREVLQELVAHAVAERVVHVLEVVEIQEKHRDAVPVALGARQRRGEPVGQQQPVGQPREAVVGGHELQALLGLDARGDVLREREDRDEAPFGVAQRRVVPLHPDHRAVLAVVAVEDRRARLRPFHQAAHHRADGFRILLVDQANRVHGAAEDLVGPEAEDRLGVAGPAHHLEVRVPLDHRKRRVVEVRGQDRVGAAQLLFDQLLVVDVAGGRVIAEVVAAGIVARGEVHVHPAAAAVGERDQALHAHVLAGFHAAQDRVQRLGAGRAQHLQDARADHLPERAAGVGEEGVVHVAVAALRVHVHHRGGDRVDHLAQFALLFLDGGLGGLQFVDVRGHHVVAEHAPGLVLARGELHAHPALVVRPRHAQPPLVMDALARDGAVEVGLQGLHQLGGIDVLRVLAEGVLAREAARGEEDVVHESASALEIDVDDRLGDVLGEEAQLLLAGAKLGLRHLQVLHVVADHVHPAHRAVGAQVGDGAAEDPAPLAGGQHQLALVGGGLAREHAARHGLQLVGGLRAKDLRGGPADDGVARHAAALAEGAVHEHVATLRVQVGHRHRDVVGEEAKLRLLLREALLGGLQLVDVGADDVVTGEGAVLAEVGLQPHLEPALVLAVRAHEALVGAGFAALQARHERRVELRRRLLAQDLADRAPDDLRCRPAADALEDLVHELVAVVRAHEGDGLGNVLRVEAQLALLALEGFAQPPVVVYVDHDREDAAGLAVDLVGNQVHPHPALGAVGRRTLALVDDFFAGEGPLERRAHDLEDLGRIQILQPAADGRFHGDAARPVEARGIREAHAPVRPDVGHGHADGLGDELQLPGAGE